VAAIIGWRRAESDGLYRWFDLRLFIVVFVVFQALSA